MIVQLVSPNKLFNVSRTEQIVVSLSECTLNEENLTISLRGYGAALITPSNLEFIDGLWIITGQTHRKWRYRETINLRVEIIDSEHKTSNVTTFQFVTEDHSKSLKKLVEQKGWSPNKLRACPTDKQPAPATPKSLEINIDSIPKNFISSGINNKDELELKRIISNQYSNFDYSILLSSGNSFNRNILSYRYSESAIIEMMPVSESYPFILPITLSFRPKSGIPITVGYFSSKPSWLQINRELIADTTIWTQVSAFSSFNNIPTMKCANDKGFCSAVDNNDNVSVINNYSENCVSTVCPLYRINSVEDEILWDNVDRTKNEFIYDSIQNKIILSNLQYYEFGGSYHTSAGGIQYLSFGTYPIPSELISASIQDVPIEISVTDDRRYIIVDTSDFPVGELIRVSYLLIPAVIYEPDISNDLVQSENIHPFKIGQNSFVLSCVESNKIPNSLVVTSNRTMVNTKETNGILHTVYDGSYLDERSSVNISLSVFDDINKSCWGNHQILISSIGSTNNSTIGYLNGREILDKEELFITDSSGRLNLIYTPPQNIVDIMSTTIKNENPYINNQIVAVPNIPYDDLVDSNGDIYTFLIQSDDMLSGYNVSPSEEDDYEEDGVNIWKEWGLPGTDSYGCNGRKELFVYHNGTEFDLVTPIILNTNGEVATEGDIVTTLIYPISIPATSKAVMLMRKKTITFYARIKDSNVVNMFSLSLNIPSHMKGILESYSQSLKSSSLGFVYTTINPSIEPVYDYDTRSLAIEIPINITLASQVRCSLSVEGSSKDFIPANYPDGTRFEIAISKNPSSEIRVEFPVCAIMDSGIRLSIEIFNREYIIVNSELEIVEEISTSADVEFPVALPRQIDPRENR